MAKNTSAAQGFLRSLLLFVVALVVFLLVMAPWRRPEPKVAVHDETAPSAADATRQTIRSAQTRRLPPSEPQKPATTKPKALAAGVAGDGEDPDIQKAINLIDSGEVTAAITLLDGVLKRDPKNEQALVEMAMIYLLDLKQPDQATNYLQRVVEVNPSNQIVMSELVSIYEEQGKLDDGLAFLTEVQTKNPASTDIAYGIGQLMTLEGRDEDAIAYLEKAAQAPEGAVRAYKDLGEAYARSGDPDKAIESFSKAISSQEKEIADKQAKGLPVQYARERLSYTQMDEARELVLRGEVDRAQQLLDEVKTVMPGDESVTALQATINRRKSG